MLKKLRLKSVLVNMGIVTAMLTVIFALVFHFTKADMEQQSIRALQILTQRAQQNMEREPWPRDVQLPYFVIRLSIWGEVTASGNTSLDLQDTEFLQELIQIACTATTPTGHIEEYELLFSRVLSPGGQSLIFVDTSVQKAALRSMVHIGLLIGFASLAVFALLSTLLARWTVKPVEQAWNQQKQFISDASHELKTPLTVIISNAELLQSEGADPENRQQFTDNILTMSGHMRQLVSGLLELTRADGGQIRSNFSQVAYSQLVSDALLPFEPLLFEKGLYLESRVEPGIRLTGSGQHLQQVVDILLDNAGKYADPGTVTVTLQRQGRNQCLLTVANPGKPIPADKLEQIFQRFYRVDPARSRTGSFGLGLAIAKSVVQEHSGKIWAESNPTGNRFCILLPCDP